ncbi:hypothetical protein BKA69DRAFT_1165271 [Paraphysoderma sedebokerense]|nr:hypothetical protein BKA69DRAFT_1165271 [Paraphysoderma sedebokerense]
MSFLPVSVLDDVAKLDDPKLKSTTASPRRSTINSVPVPSVLPSTSRQNRLSKGERRISFGSALHRATTPSEQSAVETKSEDNAGSSKNIDLAKFTISENVATKGTRSTDMQFEEDENIDFSELLGPARGTTRKEVISLKHNMTTAIEKLGSISEESNSNFSQEIHLLTNIIEDEQQIYESVFREIIRQVSINMVERGQVLEEIRNRYSAMFSRIPKLIKSMNTEVVALRRMNKRLGSELIRARDGMVYLSGQIEQFRNQDMEKLADGKHIQGDDTNSGSTLLQDHVEEIMKEYRQLYKMQRSRLEKSIQHLEREKQVWVSAATKLAIRVGQEYGISDVAVLNKLESCRVRAVNHLIQLISTSFRDDLNLLTNCIAEWKNRMVELARQIETEDIRIVNSLSGLAREMNGLLTIIGSADKDEMEVNPDEEIISSFHNLTIHDVKVLANTLHEWMETLNSIAVRYTSYREQPLIDELSNLKKLAETFTTQGSSLLERGQKHTNGQDFGVLSDNLNILKSDIDHWMWKLNVRMSGEDGAANYVIGLQNQLEDRYTYFSGRDSEKPLHPIEKNTLKDQLKSWTSQIKLVSAILSSSTAGEQQRIPGVAENWITKLSEQVNIDMEILNEENAKLHQSMVGWMVTLLVDIGQNLPHDNNEGELKNIVEELTEYTERLIQDAGDIEAIADDKQDLRVAIRSYCHSWGETAQRLLLIAGSISKTAKEHPELNPTEQTRLAMESCSVESQTGTGAVQEK